MRKIYSIAIAALCAFSATAGNFTELKELNRDALKLKNSTLEYAPASSVVAKAPAKATGSAPATIVGNSYVTVYSDGEIKCNGFIDVKVAANDSITLEGFAGGYDVKAKYDAAAGTITIPTGIVIAKHSNYGDITMHALDIKTGKYNDEPIIGTIDNNKITFNLGVYCTINMDGKQYYIIWMQDIKTTEANGKFSVTLNGNNYSAPISVSKTTENTVSIIGMSNIFYGSYYEVPATFDAAANTFTISKSSPIDAQHTSTATNIFYLFTKTSAGITEKPLNCSVTENATSIVAPSDMFLGYNKTGTSYSGYTFTSFKIDVDFNIYTAKVDDSGSSEFDPNPTIGNITYQLDPENKTAEVTGCVTGITEINIPSTVKMQNVEYTVVSIKKAAFQGNKTITTIHIPASLNKIDTDAFRNMQNLKNIYIEDLKAWCNVDIVNGNANPIYNAFSTSLEKNWGKVYFNNTLFNGELTIPSDVKVTRRSFYGLKALTKVTLSEGLDSIGDQTFANCTKLTEIAIPSTVKGIGSAFFGCEALEKITLNEGLETIGNSMLYNCKALTELTIPSTVKNIASSPFSGCTKIATVKSLSTVPPVCKVLDIPSMDLHTTPFDDFYQNATLKVPADAINAYKAADGWKIFTTIEALPSSGVEGIEADVNAPVEYYNLQGQKVAAESLVPGIYVIRQGNKASKVLVK